MAPLALRKKLYTLLLLFVFAITACQKVSFEEEVKTENKGNTTMKIITRGADGSELTAPVTIYVFNSIGALVTQQSLNNTQEGISMRLTQQEAYHIIAISADKTSYTSPSSPTLSSFIQTGASNYSKTPLQMAVADITPTSASSTLHLQMQYMVCSLNISLSSMPANCSHVSVSIGTPATGISFDGSLQTGKATVIPCTQNSTVSSTWTSGLVYILPTTGNNTTFTIQYDDEEGTHYSSINYQSSLKAGVPYTLNGGYNDGRFAVTGDIQSATWREEVNLSFIFSNDDTQTITADGIIINGENSGSESEKSIINVMDVPQAMSVWNGHLVLTSSAPDSTAPDGTTATLLLLSLSDWDKVTSATNKTTPDMAQEIAKGYEEYGISGWRIPTTKEATTLFSIAQSGTLSQLLKDANADNIALKINGSNVRYLCNEAKSTYSYATNGVLDAGATVQYHLRLVRTVFVRKNQ